MTTHMEAGKRHLSAENFERYLLSGVPAELPISGKPDATIFIQPDKRELGLRVAADRAAEKPRTGLRNLLTREVLHNGKRVLEVVVKDAALFRDAYPVLCSMADRIQLDGLTLNNALKTTVKQLASLLLGEQVMSKEREVGLFGELLMLGGFVRELGGVEAVRTWRGGNGEEHDFGLLRHDVEVKTTTNERRVHWIESVTQLVPTRTRPLWVVSHQLTAAGAGSGLTLLELVAKIRSGVGDGPHRDAFEDVLTGAGWREDDARGLTTRWTRRTETAAYLVTDTFPRITPDSIADAAINSSRIPRLKYQVDLDGFACEREVPQTISAAMSFEG